MTLGIRDQQLKVHVTNVEDKGGYAVIRFHSFRKDKRIDKFVKSYFSFWNIRGTAYDKVTELVDAMNKSGKYDDSDNRKPVRITIKDFSMSQEKYIDKKTQEEVYSKQPQFVIWDWDFPDGEDRPRRDTENEEVELPSDDDIPF